MSKVFDLKYPWPEEVKAADLILLATERNALLSKPPMPWYIDDVGIEPSKKQKIVTPWSSEEAEEIFIARFNELFHNGAAVPIR